MTEETINLGDVDPQNIFKIEAISKTDSKFGVITECGFYFVVHEQKRNKHYKISRESKKKISEILTTKAVESIEKNNVEASQKLLNAAIRYNDVNLNAMNLYAKILRGGNFLEDSLKMYGRALAIDPTNLEALVSRGNIYWRHIKKYYEAEWHFKLAFKFHPEDIFVLSNYAAFLAEIRRDKKNADKYYTKAYDSLKESLDNNNGTKENNNNITKINLNENKSKESKNLKPTELAISNLEFSKSHPQFFYNYALFCAEHMRDFNKAKTMISIYLQIRPSDEDALKLSKEIDKHRKDKH